MDLTDEPVCLFRSMGSSVIELSTYMGPTACELDSRDFVGECFVGAVAVALGVALKEVDACWAFFVFVRLGEHFEQTVVASTGLPVEEGVSFGLAVCPEVALLGLAASGLQISDGCFVDL